MCSCCGARRVFHGVSSLSRLGFRQLRPGLRGGRSSLEKSGSRAELVRLQTRRRQRIGGSYQLLLQLKFPLRRQIYGNLVPRVNGHRAIRVSPRGAVAVAISIAIAVEMRLGARINGVHLHRLRAVLVAYPSREQGFQTNHRPWW